VHTSASHKTADAAVQHQHQHNAATTAPAADEMRQLHAEITNYKATLSKLVGFMFEFWGFAFNSRIFIGSYFPV
jgi:hypothetical protein